MARITVTFQPSDRAAEVDQAAAPFSGTGRCGSILDIAVAEGVEIGANCGGHGVCGTCYVVVERGAEDLSPPDDDERGTLESMTDNDPAGRLACQAVPAGDVTVRVVD